MDSFHIVNDILELVHSHIAKQPTPPHELIGIDLEFVPQGDDKESTLNETNYVLLIKIVSDIIMKLLSKNAEDRYQSAYGLKADLEACLEQWQTLEQRRKLIIRE